MSAITVPPPHAASAPAPAERIFRVGTLEYTQQGLYVLFFWLMWNDFTMILLQDPMGFGGFLQKDLGATNEQLSIFGLIGGIFSLALGPVFSTLSDRTRTKWGRRRPYLLVFTPPLAVLIMLMPYVPTFEHHLTHYAWFNSLVGGLPIKPAVLMVGTWCIVMGIFNAITGTLFSYLYWDVVPQEVLGRWTSLVKIVGAAAGFVWQYFFFGLADHHLKALCVGTAFFALVVYLTSVIMVKEGGYGPVDPHKKGGPAFAGVRAFFVECFSDSYYLWIFLGFACASINWGTGGMITFYLRYNLHFSYGTIGSLNAWPPLLTIILGYFLGSMTDRLHPMRVFVPSYLALGIIYVGSFIFVHNRHSYFFWTCLAVVGQFANGITYGALLPQIFPREKFGQFCSANAMCSSLLNMCLTVPVGILLDYLHSNYRFGYLNGAISMFLAALVFTKVRRNFEARQGHVPVPHAG
jgi:Na+/melibiose symporter-like transporter